MKNLPKSVLHLEISNVTNDGSGLIKITTATAHGLATGNNVQITEVLGTTEANGRWVITQVNSTNFTLNGSTHVNAYTSGGKIYKPYRLSLKLSATPTGGGGYAFASVTFRPTQNELVVDNDTKIFRLIDSSAVVVLDSDPGFAYRIDEIECANRSGSTGLVFSVLVTAFDGEMDPMPTTLGAGHRVAIGAGTAPAIYDADNRAIAGVMPPIDEP